MTISAILNDTDNVIFESRLDTVEVFIISEGDGFNVTWGDYIANAWEEQYDSLGTALARVAVIVQASEINSNFGFKQADVSGFIMAWADAMDGFVFYEDGEVTA
jgi:hypothetical protein